MNKPLLSSSSLTGDEVRNRRGETLGKIEDFMLDVDGNRIAYAVLSFGGFLGMGNKLFAVPIEALTLDTEDEYLVLDADKERLKNAPGFDKSDWPDMANPAWINSVHSHYGTRPHAA